LDKYEFKLFDPSTAHQQNLNQQEEEDQKTAKATTETIEEPVRRLFEMLKPTDGKTAKGSKKK
jgi:nitric oxide reductase activation protein